MSVTDISLTTLDGHPTSLADYSDHAVLVVNVASKCGLTPQYAALEQLAKDYGDRGLTVLGVPCNQFMGQEPGTAEEIQTFCSTTYGVTFPLLAKTEVNGPGRHPLYAELTKTPDADGQSISSPHGPRCAGDSRCDRGCAAELAGRRARWTFVVRVYVTIWTSDIVKIVMCLGN
jgi:glutathione peroxidase